MISPVDTVKSEGSRIGDLKRWLGTAEEEILIISPYLTPSTLSEALSKARDGVTVTIICSWRDKDLHFGSSKLETYELCRERGWTLRVDHEGMPRTIHLKAYVIDGKSAMVGSANMTERGMQTNIESLLPVLADSHPSLSEAIRYSLAESIEVDDEVYRTFREHVSNFPDFEEPDFPKLTAVHGAMEMEVLEAMPPEPTIEQLIQLPSISKALPIRGLRFGVIRRMLRSKPLKGKASGTVNDRTKQIMHGIVESDSRFEIQKRYGTDCLVWKVHHILNEEIRRHLEPHVGKPFRELGLDEDLWDSNTLGAKLTKLRECCLNLLSEELRDAIGRLSTWKGTLRLNENGKALYPRPFGKRIVLTDEEGKMLGNSPEELLPEDRLRNQLWLPSFCLFEAPSGTRLGDVILRGLGFWESDYQFVRAMERDFEDDIQTLGEIESQFFENPFRKMSETEGLHTKVAALGGKTHLPLGHPDRTMSRYLNTDILTSIAEDILSHDH